jgi:hypothetical protein
MFSRLLLACCVTKIDNFLVIATGLTDSPLYDTDLHGATRAADLCTYLAQLPG